MPTTRHPPSGAGRRALLAREPHPYVDSILAGLTNVLEGCRHNSIEHLVYASSPSVYDGTTHAILDGRPIAVFNIGNSQPTPLADYIEALEDALGRKAQRNLLPKQPGDVKATAANTDELDAWVGFKPATPVREGARRFVEWHRAFHRIS